MFVSFKNVKMAYSGRNLVHNVCNSRIQAHKLGNIAWYSSPCMQLRTCNPCGAPLATLMAYLAQRRFLPVPGDTKTAVFEAFINIRWRWRSQDGRSFGRARGTTDANEFVLQQLPASRNVVTRCQLSRFKPSCIQLLI